MKERNAETVASHPLFWAYPGRIPVTTAGTVDESTILLFMDLSGGKTKQQINLDHFGHMQPAWPEAILT